MTDSFWSPVLLSLQVAGCSTVLVVVLGTVLGRVFARRAFRGKTLLETLLLVPMVLPPTVIGFGLLMVLGNQGLGQFLHASHSILFTWYAAVIASTVVSFPLMYQAAKTGFEMIEEEYEDRSQNVRCQLLASILVYHVAARLAFVVIGDDSLFRQRAWRIWCHADGGGQYSRSHTDIATGYLQRGGDRTE